MAHIEFSGNDITVVGEGAAALAGATGLDEEGAQVVPSGGYQQQEQQQQQEGFMRTRHKDGFGGDWVVAAAIDAGEGAVPVHLMPRTR
ncbi:MAG: hypothetical protein U0520_01535 [Candidatus Saccharimonadales bacterium]